ncbi:hypothetical protein AVEN_23863-1, partial [Araneus ventricosus]
DRHFDEFGQLAGEYWMKACINTLSLECKEVQKVIVSTSILIATKNTG